MKKVDGYKMALRTEPHLSEPGFSGFPDFQDYPYQGFPQRGSGAVRNADRIWVNTPQNRTYRVGVCK